MLSPAKAAEIAGVSRSLVSRAIRDAELIATRRNNGQWSIAEGDLDNWMSRRTTRASAPDTPPAPASARDPEDIARLDALIRETGDLRERLGRLEGELAANASRIDDLIDARDHARADLTDARSQIANLEEYRDQLRREVTTTGACVSDLTAERDKMARERDESRAEAEKSKVLIRKLSSEIEGIRGRTFFQRLFGR